MLVCDRVKPTGLFPGGASAEQEQVRAAFARSITNVHKENVMTTELISSQGSIQSSRETLVNDLKRVIGDADDLMKEVANSSVSELTTARARIEARMDEVRSRIKEVRASVTNSACRAAEVANGYIRENPWKLVGCGAVAGIVAGYLISRR